MGKIRNRQLDFLETDTENIKYKVYDSDGTYNRDETENVLYKVKKDLIPLYTDFTKEYERPLKLTTFETNLSNLFFKNQNAHFLHGDEKFIIQPASSGFIAQIQSDTNESVKALSGTKYFKSNELSVSKIAMISIDQQHNQIPKNKPLTVGFNYYIATSDETDKFELAIKLSLDETYSGSTELKEYNFENSAWEDFPAQSINQSRHVIETTTVNSWGKATVTVNPYLNESLTTDPFITVTIDRPRNIPLGTTNSDFSAIFIDNFFVAETIDFSDDKIISERKQVAGNGTFSAKLENKNFILSNEAENVDYFIGKIQGDFKRQRDSVGKKLEQCITAEIMNDYRGFLSRYEGTFRDVTIEPMSFHNKIHVDFGETFQEAASCYIDSMTYNVKGAEYQVNMHVPNQDDDIVTTYISIFD
jgi:hypothetical protein